MSFETTAERWLTTFQQDLKDFLHVVCDDANLEDPLREAAAAAVLYALAPGDVIPDSAGPLGFIDDAMVLRIVLDEVAQNAPSQFDTYRDRIPDMVDPLDEDLAESRAFLGDAYEPFRTRVLQGDKLEFKGKRVKDVLADPEWLDDEVNVAAVRLDFKPADVVGAIKRLGALQAMFRQKLIPPRAK